MGWDYPRRRRGNPNAATGPASRSKEEGSGTGIARKLSIMRDGAPRAPLEITTQLKLKEIRFQGVSGGILVTRGIE